MREQRQCRLFLRRSAEESFDPNDALKTRAADGQLLGVAGYKTSAGSFMAMNFERLRRHFGIVGAIWR